MIPSGLLPLPYRLDLTVNIKKRVREAADSLNVSP